MILVILWIHGHFDMSAYEDYSLEKLENHYLAEEELGCAGQKEQAWGRKL